ncbi:MAG: zinc ribbon domain-containing protein [Anaerolineales bacterium]|nr:zinc ribbon domain-containing protein [Anaerolineales bacterium]
MSVTHCPSCNTPVPPGSIFCDNCGYDLRSLAAASPTPAPTYQVPLPEGDWVCPACGHPNVAGSAFCENCGGQLAKPAAPPPAPAAPPPAAPPPAAPPAAPAYTPPAPQATPPAPPAPPVSPAAITGHLVIKASNVSLPIPPGKQTIVMGREDPVSGIFPDIDLDPYGAQDEGVGRRHAQLVMQGGQVCLEDLDSVNGSVVNKQRLNPRQPQPIQDGDELRLGKMILIYHAS